MGEAEASPILIPAERGLVAWHFPDSEVRQYSGRKIVPRDDLVIGRPCFADPVGVNNVRSK